MKGARTIGQAALLDLARRARNTASTLANLASVSESRDRLYRDPSASRAGFARSLALLCWTGLLFSSGATAQPRPAQAYLEWKVPALSGCIPQRELEREVEVLLGRPVFASPKDADHMLTGSAEPNGERWIAHLTLVTRAGRAVGERELSVEGGCASLNRPLIIVVATMLDTTDTQQSVPKAPSEAELALGVAFAAQAGLLPKLALGAALSGELKPTAAWPTTRLSFTGWLPQRAAIDGAGARFMAFQAALAICPGLLRAAPVSLTACIGVELGALHAQALGLSPAHAPSRLLASVPLEADLSIHLFTHLALRIGFNLSLNAFRPAFYLEDEQAQRQVVHRVGQWFGGMRIGFIADAL